MFTYVLKIKDGIVHEGSNQFSGILIAHTVNAQENGEILTPFELGKISGILRSELKLDIGAIKYEEIKDKLEFAYEFF